MAEPTLRDKVNDIINDIRNYQDMMTPQVASDKLMELTVYHSTLTGYISEFQYAYNKKFASLIEGDTKLPISKAKIIAEATEEFKDLDEAIRFEKSLLETVRSLKIWIRSRQEEYRMSGNL